MGDDRPGRGDGELLAGDLEDERPEGIERRKLVHPGSRAEIRPRVDQPREHGVRLPKELAGLGIGNRGSLARWGVHTHGCSTRSVSCSRSVPRTSTRHAMTETALRSANGQEAPMVITPKAVARLLAQVAGAIHLI